MPGPHEERDILREGAYEDLNLRQVALIAQLWGEVIAEQDVHELGFTLCHFLGQRGLAHASLSLDRTTPPSLSRAAAKPRSRITISCSRPTKVTWSTARSRPSGSAAAPTVGGRD
jgi:hypothetical protein